MHVGVFFVGAHLLTANSVPRFRSPSAVGQRVRIAADTLLKPGGAYDSQLASCQRASARSSCERHDQRALRCHRNCAAPPLAAGPKRCARREKAQGSALAARPRARMQRKTAAFGAKRLPTIDTDHDEAAWQPVFFPLRFCKRLPASPCRRLTGCVNMGTFCSHYRDSGLPYRPQCAGVAAPCLSPCQACRGDAQAVARGQDIFARSYPHGLYRPRRRLKSTSPGPIRACGWREEGRQTSPRANRRGGASCHQHC